MDREILFEWNPWWEESVSFGLTDREIRKNVEDWIKRPEIIGILGVRRCGKTSLMHILIERLLKKVNKKNILFIKCDDDRLEKEGLISEVIEMYREVINPKGRVFIFLDEVQDIKNWESTLKRLYDIEKDIKFFLTGSNFSLLKEDLSSKLAGRLAYFELYPFSFKEFLSLKDVSKGVTGKRDIKHFLLEYIEYGGFPEIVNESDKKRKVQLLQFYYDTIVYRDILKRREIRSAAKMERMINYLLHNISSPASLSKIGKLVSLSADSVGDYLRYMQDVFFIFNVSLYSFSVKKQEMNPKKIYCVDNGIRNARGFRFSSDIGKLVENLIFIDLKKRYSTNPLTEVYYWQGEKGVDFIVREGSKLKEIIQVCWEMKKQETIQREKEGLIEGMEKLGLNKGIVITKDIEKEERVGRKTIKYVPLHKWLLN